MGLVSLAVGPLETFPQAPDDVPPSSRPETATDSSDPNRNMPLFEKRTRLAEKYNFIKFMGLLSQDSTHISLHFNPRNVSLAR